MNTLYPLKFKPQIKEKVWGGSRLKNALNKPVGTIEKAGESWELSGIHGNLSVVENGFLRGNNIEELIEVYMGDLVGDSVYEKFGLVFPLLIKFIDANDFLSIQVHPDDEMAYEQHKSYGKTEMWYIVKAEKDAELIIGFNQQMTKQKFLSHFGSGTLREILNFEKVNSGDVYYIPSGRIHSTGPGILFAEIQQTSDITYRIYDWDRVGNDGKPRELHTTLATDALDFTYFKDYKTKYKIQANKTTDIVKCDYFTTNIIKISSEIEKDYYQLDSFVIYMGISGETEIKYNMTEFFTIKAGETILLPAILKNFTLKPITKNAELLEVFID